MQLNVVEKHWCHNTNKTLVIQTCFAECER